MEVRKLIKFGKSSYVVSLPSKWVRAAGLKKGDDLFVSERDREIIISAKDSSRERRREYAVNAEGKSLRELETEIVSAYLNNYDVIRVFEKPSLRNSEKIRSIMRNLAGLEILEQTKTKMVAKDLVDIRELSVEALLRRLDVITRSVFDDLVSSVSAREAPPYHSIKHRDQDVNRLVFLSFRVLRRALSDPAVRSHLGLSVLEAHKYYMIVLRIEKIGDFAKRIAKNLQRCS
ncbi:phosphate uptake regulator PhoU, partial [Candidatus Woesearchaeota archaeon]